MRLRFHLPLSLLCVALALPWTGCGGRSHPKSVNGVTAVGASSCGPVEYRGSAQPGALIVSDLPMQGASAERSAQQVDAIRLALGRASWQVGNTGVAFQACDDSTSKTGLWDANTCRENAAAYAADPMILGVIGTYNSGCAAVEIPILNQAGVAMISPGNTAVCLTQESPSCTDYSPRTLYPAGRRNYVRVVPNDAFQAAGLAEFARSRGIRRPFVLHAANDPTSSGQATAFRGAARRLGLSLAGFRAWSPGAKSYVALWGNVKQSGADAVVLAGLIEQNGGALIRDKARVLGANTKVALLAFDGFSQQSTIDQAGGAAKGMFASIPGRSLEELSAAGRRVVSQLEASLNGRPVEIYAPYGYEAAQVLLTAIRRGGGSRARVVSALFATPRRNGILGSYRFEPSGDPSVGPVTIFLAGETFRTYRLITPAPATVNAARLGG